MQMIESRESVQRLLENYLAEREAISKVAKQLQAEADSLLYPSVSFENTPVQQQFNQGAYLETLLNRCEQSRQYYRQTVSDLIDQANTLDLMMRSVNRLPGHLKLVVIDTMINGESVGSYAERKGLSEETIVRYRMQAVSRLYYTMTARKVGVS